MNLKIVTQADVNEQTAKGQSGVKIGGDFKMVFLTGSEATFESKDLPQALKGH